ncbi:MAG: Bro-N domain-containing protein [Candidatus Gracilibacteria bacterium]|nr:Bro-N domain-containing protein [Candidatus Gracilibacteria bacterium]
MSKEIESRNNKIAIFEGKEVRKIIHNNEWWFSVVDVVSILSGSEAKDPSTYWRTLKGRLKKEGSEVVTNCHGLKLVSSDGKKYITDCANTETILRIIQSIPSPRAEPFKRWLAQVGYERIQEIEDPELAMTRMIETYEKKGYPKDWIDIRTRGIPVRKGLTNEWDQRGGSGIGYGILTNEVYKAYSGMDNKTWMKHKGMKSGNLRDGMTPTELILTMLAEQATTDITKVRDADGLEQLKKASKDGGGVAFKARQELIEQTGNDPITSKNFLKEVKESKKINGAVKKLKKGGK